MPPESELDCSRPWSGHQRARCFRVCAPQRASEFAPLSERICLQVYQELDEKLQQAFEDMLSERGVTPELGEYLMRLSEDKEQREYMGWLQRVAEVIK